MTSIDFATWNGWYMVLVGRILNTFFLIENNLTYFASTFQFFGKKRACRFGFKG